MSGHAGQDKDMPSVMQRLQQALKLDSDTALALVLDLSVQALNKRKLRNSIPVLEIDAVIAKHGLSSDWVYGGTGPMYAEGSIDARKRSLLHEVSEHVGRLDIPPATKDSLCEVIRNILLGDSNAVMAAATKDAQLTASERAVIDALRAAPPHVSEAMATLACATVPQT